MRDAKSRVLTDVTVPRARRSWPGLFGFTAAAVIAGVVAIIAITALRSASDVAAPGRTALPTTTAPTATVPASTASPGAPATTIRCGRIGQWIRATSSAPGSFMLTPAEGPPMWIRIPAGQVGEAANYVCVSVTEDNQLAGFLTPGARGYINEGATGERPPPTGSATVTGSLGYPSDFVPALAIYALPVADPSRGDYVIYTEQSGPAPSGTTTYTMRLPPGTYYFVAYLRNAPVGTRQGGAYTEYVVCGMQPPCADHQLLEVTIGPGETKTSVDIRDWYAGTDGYPARPR